MLLLNHTVLDRLRAQNAELQYRYDCMKLGAQLFRAFAIRAESVDLYEKACEVDRDIKVGVSTYYYSVGPDTSIVHIVQHP